MDVTKRMVEQVIKYSDGSETSVKYDVDEEALQAVETRVAEDVAEVTTNEVEESAPVTIEPEVVIEGTIPETVE